jgi:hypothetical protein
MNNIILANIQQQSQKEQPLALFELEAQLRFSLSEHRVKKVTKISHPQSRAHLLF